jgi:hypothetical protein
VTAILLPNGNLLIPKRAESDGVLGDGMVEIAPEHPDFADWGRRKWRTLTMPSSALPSPETRAHEAAELADLARTAERAS